MTLDFGAIDEDGRPTWNPVDVSFDIEQVVNAESTLLGYDAETLVPHVDPNTLSAEQKLVRQKELAQLAFDRLELEESLLPPESDYEVILIDALAGNDEIYVGPTVQRTVWADAGDGDDLVRISSGNAILVDKADLRTRNDIADSAYHIGGNSELRASPKLTGLTLDNPTDVDWYRFNLPSTARPNAQILAESASDLDGLNLELYRIEGGDDLTGIGYYSTLMSKDAIDTGGSNDSRETAYVFEDEESIQNFLVARGLTIDHGPNPLDPDDIGDQDWFRFTLSEAGGEDDAINLVSNLENIDSLVFQLYGGTVNCSAWPTRLPTLPLGSTCMGWKSETITCA